MMKFNMLTPLHKAVEKENIPIIKLLLKLPNIDTTIKNEIFLRYFLFNLQMQFLMVFTLNIF